MLQTDREDVLSHRCYSWELHHTVGLHGGSVRHRAAKGTHTHTHIESHSIIQTVSTLFLIQTHLSSLVIFCSCEWHTHTHTCLNEAAGSQLILWSSLVCLMVRVELARFNRAEWRRRWRSEAEMGSVSVGQMNECSQIWANRSRITVTPCAGVKL